MASLTALAVPLVLVPASGNSHRPCAMQLAASRTTTHPQEHHCLRRPCRRRRHRPGPRLALAGDPGRGCLCLRRHSLSRRRRRHPTYIHTHPVRRSCHGQGPGLPIHTATRHGQQQSRRQSHRRGHRQTMSAPIALVRQRTLSPTSRAKRLHRRHRHRPSRHRPAPTSRPPS